MKPLASRGNYLRKDQVEECFIYYASIWWEHYAMMTVVCPSVCPLPDPKSRTEGRRNLKIDRKESHDTGHP